MIFKGNNLLLKYSFFISLYKNYNISINNINNINFNKLINLFYKNFYVFMLNNSLDNRYSWSYLYADKNDKELSLNFFIKKTIKNNINLKLCYKNHRASSIIIFKKNTSLFKKVFDIDFSILSKISSYSKNASLNIFKNYNKNLKNDYNINNMEPSFLKTLDLKKKIKTLFNVNRKIAKKLFNIKKIKQHAITRKLKHICNIKKRDNFINLENSLINIIMHSDFFFSEKDCIWFIKNGFICLNSVQIENYNQLVKPYDIINLYNHDFYYIYYKNKLSSLMVNTYKINSKLWSITKNRRDSIYYRGVKNINFTESYPNFFKNFKFFKKDVPLNLEVDYVSMTIILLYYNKNPKLFSFYNLKFFNFYLNRLYNWKFVT